MLKQERRRAAEAETALKKAGLPIPDHTPILGRTSPIMTSVGEVGRKSEGEREGEGKERGCESESISTDMKKSQESWKAG